jgi:Zn-dependent M28 family amino/carboxypeptidase
VKRLRFLPVLILAVACQPAGEPDEMQHAVAALQATALEDDTAWQLLESLTTGVGPRMGGTEGDEKAVAWARQVMKDLEFDRVWLEHVSFPLWQRRSESAQVVGPVSESLAVTALGGSPGTGGALTGEVVHFPNLEALEESSPESVAGKIAFISERMVRSRDGSGYGKTVRQRSRGPFVAARKGALALLIRSAGTNGNGRPHTGMISGSEPGDPVPSAALSHPSADLIEELLAGPEPVTVELTLDCGFNGIGTSQNVIGEFDGRADSSDFVVVGGHLDSWDLGEGAVDDGAGVATTLAAAKLVAGLPERPGRDIRVVLFANEEQGIHGGKTYASAQGKDFYRHVIGAESDLGSGRIWRFRSRVLADAEAEVQRLAGLLEPLDIPWSRDRPASGGADLGQMRKLGMPVIDLNHDASRYFDLHHTADDTLDKVDPADIRFNVAAYVTFIYWAAESEVDFGPVEPSE